jgi:hypothetical protein
MGHMRSQQADQTSIFEVFGKFSRHRSASLGPLFSSFCLRSQDSSEVLSAFSVSEEVLSGEKASFFPPLALLGYIPIPTFCSSCPRWLTQLICLRKEEETSTKGISVRARLYRFLEVPHERSETAARWSSECVAAYDPSKSPT